MTRSVRLLFAVSLVVFACSFSAVRGADPSAEAFTDRAKAGPSYLVQGEYSGDIDGGEGVHKTGVQIVALGNDKYDAVVYQGGLPGEGWYKESGTHHYAGVTEKDVTVFRGNDATGKLVGGVLTVSDNAGKKLGELHRVERKSPTLGIKPPPGAVVLFDGASADKWNGGQVSEDGLLLPGPTTKDKFRDFQIHLEFATPYMPTARGQGRGNSGLYLQARYEIQVLDSFGLEGKDNECGGFYSITAPAVNMCFPPLVWQTYDIDFTGARFDEAKKKTHNAVVTARHNGVLIHDKFELPKVTPGGIPLEQPGEGPFHLQDHGNPVRFRNIWVVEKK